MMKTTSPLLLSVAIFLGSVSAAQSCDFLKDKTPEQAQRLNGQRIIECIERGEDPPRLFRSGSGFARKVASGGASTMALTGGTCGPGLFEACPNTKLEYTDIEEMPENTPDFSEIEKIDPVVWGEFKGEVYKCGALAQISKMAVNAIWGNVNLPTNPINLKQGIETSINGLTPNLHLDCQNSKFWRTVNTVAGLIIPHLGINRTCKVGQSSFLTCAGTKLSLPMNQKMKIDLLGGMANFHLPNGGSFIDINGNNVTIGPNNEVKFNTDGTVVINGPDGKPIGSYRVDPQQIVELDPGGLISIPDGTVIPIDPKVVIVPPSPVIKLPKPDELIQ